MLAGNAQALASPYHWNEAAVHQVLINEIVAEDELLGRAFDWARRICANAPLAVFVILGSLSDAAIIRRLQPQAVSPRPYAALLDDFERWMTEERGLSPRTLKTRRWHLRRKRTRHLPWLRRPLERPSCRRGRHARSLGS